MRRMYSENQLIELIQQYGGQVTPEDIQEMFDDGDVNLFGKYVRIMDAPESTTLTDEEIAIIDEGVFFQGTFLGYKNPILFPFSESFGVKRGMIIGQNPEYHGAGIDFYSISAQKTISIINRGISLDVNSELVLTNLAKINNKRFPVYPATNNVVAQFLYRKGNLEWYIPVSQDGITSGDTIALDSDLGKALIDHLDVVINGYMARYEYTSGNYVVYSSKTEVNSGAKLQVNMISYNTTNGTLSFNQMTFTPDN